MSVVEDDPRRIVADGFDGNDFDVTLAANDLFLRGNSTRRYSARSANDRPSSKLIDSEAREESTRNSIGQGVGIRCVHFRARSASLNSRASPGSMIGMPLRMG
jgi:hypothetical protein